jgi:hypothetical protein
MADKENQEERDYSDPIFRYYEMFCMIKRGEENAISTSQILQTLNNTEKYKHVKKRTVQRDLLRISDQGENSRYPLRITYKGKANYWYWDRNCQFPMMTVDEALAFKLNEMFIQPVLPTSCQILESYYQQANQTLTRNGAGAWAEKIRVTMPAQPFINKMFEQLDVVAAALLHEKQFSANFNDEYCLFNPLGLLFELGNATLVATIGNDDEVLKFSLFEFENAQMTGNDVITPRNFNLDDYA